MRRSVGQFRHPCLTIGQGLVLRMFFSVLIINSFMYKFPVKLSIRSLSIFSYLTWWEHEVLQSVELLSYKPEGRGLDPRFYHWNFSLT
jgi:hypothetical protein